MICNFELNSLELHGIMFISISLTSKRFEVLGIFGIKKKKKKKT